MLIRSVKKLARPLVQEARGQASRLYVSKKIATQGAVTKGDFDFRLMKQQVSGFLESLRQPDSICHYRYSQSCSEPTLYASAYASMTKSMIGELSALSEAANLAWVDYFDSFQSKNGGLFWDPAVRNEIYSHSDWWGARHLALHMVSAYTDLGARPRYPFLFLEPYYDSGSMQSWLEQYDWDGVGLEHSDVDNQIMNIGCLLQYQRDTWGDNRAGRAVERLKSYLRSRINPHTGIWTGLSPVNKYQRSRAVQFAYHLFPLFFYDGDFDFNADRVVSIVLQTQNEFGGFGVLANSSACEDIDSIELLIRFRPYVSENARLQIDTAIENAFSWVLLNQAEDGGFVFRLNQKHVYGSRQTSSEANRGAMLPTWFRTLSIAHMARHFGYSSQFRINKCPGLKY